MPVKYLHKRYVCFRVSNNFIIKKFIDTYISLYGLVRYSLSGFKIVKIPHSKDIIVIRIGSKHVNSLIATATYHSILNSVNMELVGVYPTIKKLKNSLNEK